MAHSPGFLGAEVREVTLEFNVSKRTHVPRHVLWVAMETRNRLERRRAEQAVGEQFLFVEKDSSGGSVRDLSLIGIVPSLATAGFVLVDAVAEERLRSRSSGPTFFSVRYTFKRKETALWSPDFRAHMQYIVGDFEKFLALALWKVNGYRIPLALPNDEIASRIHLAMSARNPLFAGDDLNAPKLHWERNVERAQVGDAPIRLSANRYVSVVDGTVCFVPAGEIKS